MALAVMTDGRLAVGGGFTEAGGVRCSNLAAWNGGEWSELGGGTDVGVTELIATGEGGLLVGGPFTRAGSVAAGRIARWTGSEWLTFGTGLSGNIHSLLLRSNGELIAGGTHLLNIGPTQICRAARWDGGAWIPMLGGAAPNHVVYALGETPAGVIAGGQFYWSGVAPSSVALWDGELWGGTGNGPFSATKALLIEPSGRTLVGGNFGLLGGNRAWGLALLTNGTWSLPSGAETWIPVDLVATAQGQLFAAGEGFALGGAMSYPLYRRGPTGWVRIEGAPNDYVSALAALPDGSVVVGGSFTMVGSVPASRVAVWNGLTWAALGAGLPATVVDVAVLPDGDVVAAIGSGDGVWRWTGGQGPVG
jgi:hypothetical protein